MAGSSRSAPIIGYTPDADHRLQGALVVAPILTAFIGLAVERLLIRPLYGRDPLYGLLLTFGLAYIFEDGTRMIWGAQSLPFQVPADTRAPAVEPVSSSSPAIASL